MSLVPVDTTSAVAVTDYLTKARDWLNSAVETSTPLGIGQAKVELAVAAEATKQLNLSQEIQQDAEEMVRRAEFVLRKAVNKAQAEGEIADRRSNLIPGGPSAGSPAPRSSSLPSARDFFSGKQEYEDANAMADLEPEQFDEVIEEAKSEGNLSRANVARKAREKAGAPPRATPRRALPDVARDLGIDLRRLTERFERLRADDRFGRNKNEVAAHLRHHLAHALAVLTDLEQEINSHQETTNV